MSKHISQRAPRVFPFWSMSWFWKFVFKVLDGVMDADEEHPATLLCNAIITGHQHFHFHFVAMAPIIIQLPFKKPTIRRRDHPAHIFHEKEFRLNLAKCPKEFSVEIIAFILLQVAPLLHIRRPAFRGFTEPGAWVTANEDVSFWKFFDSTNIPFMKFYIGEQ